MIPMNPLRQGQYRVRITVDLLAAPHLEDSPDAYVHGVAIKTFVDAMREVNVPVDMARTTVVMTVQEDPDLAAIGQKTYVWTFTFPVPLFHPANTL